MHNNIYFVNYRGSLKDRVDYTLKYLLLVFFIVIALGLCYTIAVVMTRETVLSDCKDTCIIPVHL